MSALATTRYRLALLACCGLALWSALAVAQPEGSPVRDLLIAAAAAMRQGDLDGAERRLEEAAEAAPEVAAPWLGLAEVEERRGSYGTALEHARRAQQLAPDEARVSLTVGRLLAREGAEGEALEALAAARSANPSLEEAWSLAALMMRDQGRHEEAAALLAAGVDQVADPRTLARELGFLYLALGRGEEAGEVVARYLAADEEVASLVLRGLVLATEPSQREQAIELLQRALAGGAPREAQLRLDLASLLLDAGRAEEAADQLRQAAAARPDLPEVQYRLALALRAAGDQEGSNAALTAYRELQRRFEEGDREAKELGIALNEARELANANRLPEALEKTDEILARGGARPAVLSLRAKLLASMRRVDEALADVRRAAALAPGNVELAYLEGVFLLQLQQPGEAETALRRALTLDPDLGEAHELLGGLVAAAGRWGEALGHLEKAKQAGISSERLDRLLAEARRQVGDGDPTASSDAALDGG